MRLNTQRGLEAKAWSNGRSIQLEIGPYRFTAAEVQAVDLARQIVAEVDELKAVDNRPAGR
jgi:hypothetical protein